MFVNPCLEKPTSLPNIHNGACSARYGQTGRLLKTRVDEHKAAVKYGKSDVSAVAEHVWLDEHEVEFQSVSVLAWEHDLHRRLSLES